MMCKQRGCTNTPGTIHDTYCHLHKPKSTPTRTLNDSEIATILHGLRMIQENANGHADCLAGCCDHFDEADELNDTQIDILCEDLNLDSVTVPDTSKINPKLKK